MSLFQAFWACCQSTVVVLHVPLFSAQRIFGPALTPVQSEWVCPTLCDKVGDDKCEEVNSQGAVGTPSQAKGKIVQSKDPKNDSMIIIPPYLLPSNLTHPRTRRLLAMMALL